MILMNGSILGCYSFFPLLCVNNKRSGFVMTCSHTGVMCESLAVTCRRCVNKYKWIIRGLRHTRLRHTRPRSQWRNLHAIRKGETTRHPKRTLPGSSYKRREVAFGGTGIWTRAGRPAADFNVFPGRSKAAGKYFGCLNRHRSYGHTKKLQLWTWSWEHQSWCASQYAYLSITVLYVAQW
jgi:hypothetical protein